jgi:fructokinase
MSRRPCIFGEVLFDHFADGKRVLGGAPFNVAWHLQAFGQSPLFISRVGEDAEGEEILEAMRSWGMDSSAVQRDPERPTGKVTIRIEDGEPAYDIVEDCAYDAVDADEVEAAAALNCSFLYHGSLALRGEITRRALQRLQATGPRTTFVDVNLRNPWWRRDKVLEFAHHADWVKLNRDELELLGRDNSGKPIEPTAFLDEYDLRGLVLTLGSAGARLYTPDAEPLRVAPGKIGELVDTVGAGDAFASVMILGLLREWPPRLTLERAQEFASKIVGQRGATTTERSFYRPFLNNWELESE